VAEQRRARRFELKLPVEVVRVGSRRITHYGETRNVSSGGILFTSVDAPLSIGQSVEYLISLPTGPRIGDVRLRCMGKVIRRDDGQHALAATLERYEFIRTVAATA
jgi:hypothetical protein